MEVWSDAVTVESRVIEGAHGLRMELEGGVLGCQFDHPEQR